MKSFLREEMKKVVALVMVGALAVPNVAFAQNASTMADARFHEGLAFVQAGQYEQARLAFAQAYAISKDATTLYNLALAEMKTGHDVEAIRHFRQFKRDPNAKQSDIPQCDELIKRMEAQTCQVNVTTAPGAEITVDGQRWGENAPTSDPIDVGEGKHTIRVQLGARWASKDVDAQKGQEIHITLDVGVSEHHEDHPVEPPEHEKKVMFPPPTGAIILGGLGLVGLGVGIGMGVASSGSASDAQALADRKACANTSSADCASLKSKNDTAKSDGLVSVIGYAGGGALLAGGIVWWLVAPRHEMVSVEPSVGPHAASINLSGRF